MSVNRQMGDFLSLIYESLGVDLPQETPAYKPFKVINKETGEEVKDDGYQCIVLFRDGSVGSAYRSDCFTFDDQEKYEISFLEDKDD